MSKHILLHHKTVLTTFLLRLMPSINTKNIRLYALTLVNTPFPFALYPYDFGLFDS